MTRKNFVIKALLSLLITVLLLGSLSVFSLAADKVENLKQGYGSVIPTDSKLEAPKSSYTFYGDSGKLYFMRISKGKENAKFAVEIYSDSNYQNQIRSFNSDYSKTASNKPLSITWSFKDIESGKYYGRCYTYVETGEEDRTIDSSSFKKFEININRVGKKEVKLNSVNNSVNGPVIKWSTLPTGKEYYVYRKEINKTGWVKLATVGEDTTSYTDKTAKSGKNYTYTVRCNDGKYTSLYNKTGLKITCLATPKLKSVAGTGAAGDAVLKWNKVSGAKGYYVYRKGGTLSEYEWKKIATIKSGDTVSYTDKKARNASWNYTYTVKAYNGKSYSGHDTLGLDFDYIPAPSLKKASSYYGGMKIEWGIENENIIEYIVYRKDNGKWKKIGETRNKYFIDTTAASNKSYTYTVKALSDTNCGAFNSKGITAKFIATPEVSPITFNTKEASVVKWTKVTGAAGYKVYRKINDASNWSLIATVKGGSKLSYNDTVAKESGNTYTYTVRAYDSANKTGYYMLNGVTGTFLSSPVFTANQIITEDGSLAIGVSWEPVAGAECYNVYKRLPGESWVLIAEKISEINYVDAQIENAKTYDYAVRALTNNGDISKYDTKAAYAVTIPVLESVTVEETGAKLIWNALEGATGYKVYRMAKDSAEWTLLATVETNEYLDATEEALKEPFFYTVSAQFNEYESAKYDGIKNFTEVSASAAFDAEKNAIALAWETDAGAVVTIEKAANEEPALPMGDFSSEKECTDTGIFEGNLYTYTITAKSEGKIATSVTVTAKYPHPPLEKAVVTAAAPTYSDGAASCVISWTTVAFADRYVLIRTSADGEEIELATITADMAIDGGFSYTDTDIPADGSYTYSVKAIATESERDESVSEPSETVNVYKQLSALTDLKVTSDILENAEVNAVLTWAPVENADKYLVYRQVKGGEWILQQEIVLVEGEEGEEPTLATTYTDENIENGVEYSYCVRAVAENRGEVINFVDYCWGEPADKPTDEPTDGPN